MTKGWQNYLLFTFPMLSSISLQFPTKQLNYYYYYYYIIIIIIIIIILLQLLLLLLLLQCLLEGVNQGLSQMFHHWLIYLNPLSNLTTTGKLFVSLIWVNRL